MAKEKKHRRFIEAKVTTTYKSEVELTDAELETLNKVSGGDVHAYSNDTNQVEAYGILDGWLYQEANIYHRDQVFIDVELTKE